MTHLLNGFSIYGNMPFRSGGSICTRDYFDCFFSPFTLANRFFLLLYDLSTNVA